VDGSSRVWSSHSRIAFIFAVRALSSRSGIRISTGNNLRLLRCQVFIGGNVRRLAVGVMPLPRTPMTQHYQKSTGEEDLNTHAPSTYTRLDDRCFPRSNHAVLRDLLDF
jgi:hypothetical protein